MRIMSGASFIPPLLDFHIIFPKSCDSNLTDMNLIKVHIHLQISGGTRNRKFIKSLEEKVYKITRGEFNIYPFE